MDKRIERLHAMGCNTAEALERMADDEAFYMDCLQEALKNPGFEGLERALAAGDTAAAFDCAHALKGVLGSVGLTPMFKKTTEIVEPLRAGRCDGLGGKLAELMEMRLRFGEVVGPQ